MRVITPPGWFDLFITSPFHRSCVNDFFLDFLLARLGSDTIINTQYILADAADLS